MSTTRTIALTATLTVDERLSRLERMVALLTEQMELTDRVAAGEETDEDLARLALIAAEAEAL